MLFEQKFLSFNFEIKFKCPFQKLFFKIVSWMLKMPFNKGNEIPNAFYYTELSWCVGIYC